MSYDFKNRKKVHENFISQSVSRVGEKSQENSQKIDR
jgi:hypothetical protein